MRLTGKPLELTLNLIKQMKDDSAASVSIEVAMSLVDTIEAFQRKNEQLRAQAARMKHALEHIAEYWNRNNNEKAMEDVCWHAIETAKEALSTDAGKGYHNSADVEAMKMAREAIILEKGLINHLKHSCRLKSKKWEMIVDKALAEIDKVLGGGQNGSAASNTQEQKT